MRKKWSKTENPKILLWVMSYSNLLTCKPLMVRNGFVKNLTSLPPNIFFCFIIKLLVLVVLYLGDYCQKYELFLFLCSENKKLCRVVSVKIQWKLNLHSFFNLLLLFLTVFFNLNMLCVFLSLQQLRKSNWFCFKLFFEFVINF
jgi:hypothetical protein